jgi:hypothetical protein
MTGRSILQEREEAERVHGADPAAAKPSAKGAGTFDPDESLAAAQEAAGVAAEEEQVQPQKKGPTPAQRTAIQVGVLHNNSRGQALHRCVLGASAGKAEAELLSGAQHWSPNAILVPCRLRLLMHRRWQRWSGWRQH